MKVDANVIFVIFHQATVTVAVIGLSSHHTFDSLYATVELYIQSAYTHVAAARASVAREICILWVFQNQLTVHSLTENTNAILIHDIIIMLQIVMSLSVVFLIFINIFV